MSSSRTTPEGKNFAMDSSLPHDLTNVALPTTPQQSLDRAEAMLQQAEGLRKEARALQSQIQGLNKRADTLTKSALTFQTVAARDRQTVQYTLEGGLVVFEELVATYKSLPQNATRLQALQTRVEDGLATLQDLQDIFQDMKSFCKDARVNRSPAPEPESPPETGPTTVSEKVGSHRKARKRSFATLEEDYIEPSPASKEVTMASNELTAASNLIALVSHEMTAASMGMVTGSNETSAAITESTAVGKRARKKNKGSVASKEAEEINQPKKRRAPRRKKNNLQNTNQPEQREKRYRKSKSNKPIKQEEEA
ncbi:hypothetical protein LTS07_001152 [Exophiala sideris]|uniref:Inhibitor of growth protein N-terminal histone-binding domain-containing protein n=1 Tax=Exophiala sideris TaxID=1016849 RepID=A0ABR0JMH4_9EURO|nr:hypothetical protein LTS07_001152 [Exophiala sideris]KAK5043667.1 hypothetical protein LTR13_000021 [Exophiala sideris]KAK5067166.1 hypothetical protein LTR69_001153 [Exophiala sideris]KAK5182499.1 hypothetical protein LTR44_004890 [Eurotiomycetes sp. CCFEE 6388]